VKRERLDKAMVRREIVPSRARAQEHIAKGEVFVNGLPANKPSTMVERGADIKLQGERLPYVSRGGLKLEQALRSFDVPVQDKRCVDVGASTGGFTDCLLQHGAKTVHAIDVGYGQLAWKLRDDARVIVMERTNIRDVTDPTLMESFALAVIDCSFIGLDLVLPHVAPLLRLGGEVVALVKPQFEAGKDGVGKGGVVRDQSVREQAIQKVRDCAIELGFDILAGEDCDTHGPSGNVEYLLYLRRTRRVRTDAPADPSNPLPDIAAVE